MKASQLITEIEKAFSGIPTAATSLRQFKLTDLKGMTGDIPYTEYELAGKTREDSRWEDIPESEIEDCGCLLAHMQAEEFKYYLPAYMRYSLKNFEPHQLVLNDIMGGIIFNLTVSSNDEYTLSQISLLNNQQTSVVREFLHFIVDNAQSTDLISASEALKSHWES